MRVLVLIDAWFPFTGGAQIQVKNLKKILGKDYNCSCQIFHSPSANIIVRFFWLFWVVPQAIISHFFQKKFDLVHAHAFWPGLPGKIIAEILNIPLVFTVHGSHLMDLKCKGFKTFLEKFILTKIRYNRLISVASNFLNYENVNRGNIEVIANGVDLAAFDKVKVKKDKKFKIIFVGRDHPHKGLKFLKQAVKEVKKYYPYLKVKIIQQGTGRKELIKEYKSSHLFVLPSLAEGQPLSLLEAWAAKLPVVVTKVGENTKMVKNGLNGYLVEPGQPAALKKAILKVLKNKKRDQLGKKGYQLVKKNYTWRQTARKTYAVYQKTLVKK